MFPFQHRPVRAQVQNGLCSNRFHFEDASAQVTFYLRSNGALLPRYNSLLQGAPALAFYKCPQPRLFLSHSIGQTFAVRSERII